MNPQEKEKKWDSQKPEYPLTPPTTKYKYLKAQTHALWKKNKPFPAAPSTYLDR
jgi:hypothetical protein